MRSSTLALAAALLLLLSGCARATPTDHSYVGTWQHGHIGAVVMLDSSHTCRVEQVPIKLIIQSTEHPHETFSGACTWERGDGIGDLISKSGYPMVDLSFEDDKSAPASGWLLFWDGAAGSGTLFVTVGDPDEHKRYVLTKH